MRKEMSWELVAGFLRLPHKKLGQYLITKSNPYLRHILQSPGVLQQSKQSHEEKADDHTAWIFIYMNKGYLILKYMPYRKCLEVVT